MKIMELLAHHNASSPDPLHQEVIYQRPLVFSKMESIIKEMQDPEHGVPVRSQKVFLSSIPAAFAGYDLIEWLMERFSIEDSNEAIHLANLLCQHGYFFPVGDNKALNVKDDSSLYRFQTPYYWPSQVPCLDSVDYAIYLAKRTLRNKQKHGLDDYEIDAFNELRKNLIQKWDFISMQADEQVKITKERKKVEKMVTDSQEKAFWRVVRPPPGYSSCVEMPPPHKARLTRGNDCVKQIRTRINLLEDLTAEVELLRKSCIRTRIKVSQALESLASHCESYQDHDAFLVPRQPSNPWISDDVVYWVINAPLVDVLTDRRVKKWSISMEDLVFDPTGLREFTTYLKKEYCHENIRFWLAVRDLRFGPISQLRSKAQQIYNEFLSPGAPCEINIDMRTMEAVQKELNSSCPSRFTFDPAAGHVYAMLLKKDCYPRFIRSEHYKSLLAHAIQPNQKKRFFGLMVPGKKKSSTTSPPVFPCTNLGLPSAVGDLRIGDDVHLFGTGLKSDLISASSQDTDKVSVLAECPYRGDMIPDDKKESDSGKNTLSQASMDDVCPWESMEKLPEKTGSSFKPSSLGSATTYGVNPQISPKKSVLQGIDASKNSKLLVTGALSVSCVPGNNLSVKPGLVSQARRASTGKAISKHKVDEIVTKRASFKKQASTTSSKLEETLAASCDKGSQGTVCSEKKSMRASTSSVNDLKLCDEKEQLHIVDLQQVSKPEGVAISDVTTTTDSIFGSICSPYVKEEAVSPDDSIKLEDGQDSSTEGCYSLAQLAQISFIESDYGEEATSPGVDSHIAVAEPSSIPSKIEDNKYVSVQNGLSAGLSGQDTRERGWLNEEEVRRMSKDSSKPSLSRKNSVDSATLAYNYRQVMEGQPKDAGNEKAQSRKSSCGGPPPNMAEVCPWDCENGSQPETSTFVKTYATLGYL